MDMEFQTKLLHGKAVDNYANGSTVPPISLANAFAYESYVVVFAFRISVFAVLESKRILFRQKYWLKL